MPEPAASGRVDRPAQHTRFVGGLLLLAFLVLAALDAGALAAWIVGSPRLPGPATSLALHAGVSLACGVVLALATGGRASAARAGTSALVATAVVAALAFCLPVLGGIGSWLAFSLGRAPRASPATERRQRLPMTIDWDDPALKATPPRRRALADSLSDELGAHAPERAERRLQAMLRVRRLPLRLQAPLARIALADPSEDVRLFAFSLIERLRSAHESALRTWTARSAQTATAVDAAKVHLRLAEIHWEMVYQGLSEGAVLEHTLKQALVHADQALAAPGTSPFAETSVYMLRGRILLRLDELAGAESAFRRALGAGHEANKVLPYLAECAFRLRNFPALRWYLTRLRAVGGSVGRFSAVMEHWL